MNEARICLGICNQFGTILGKLLLFLRLWPCRMDAHVAFAFGYAP
jgi:hypothetical protein